MKLFILFIIIYLLINPACGPNSGQYDVNIPDTEHTIRIINPIIEYCERLYPEVLYPIEVEREQGITDCMKLCQESGDCQIDLPNADQQINLPVGF